jgi:hypothetical protein
VIVAATVQPVNARRDADAAWRDDIRDGVHDKAVRHAA